MKEGKKRRYFAVLAKDPKSSALPRREFFVAENEEDAIIKMKNTLGRETLEQSPKIEFVMEEISESEYKRELARIKDNIERERKEDARDSAFRKWHEGKIR